MACLSLIRVENIYLNPNDIKSIELNFVSNHSDYFDNEGEFEKYEIDPDNSDYCFKYWYDFKMKEKCRSSDHHSQHFYSKKE